MPAIGMQDCLASRLKNGTAPGKTAQLCLLVTHTPSLEGPLPAWSLTHSATLPSKQLQCVPRKDNNPYAQLRVCLTVGICPAIHIKHTAHQLKPGLRVSGK